MSALVGDAVGVIRHLGYEKCVLVGHGENTNEPPSDAYGCRLRSVARSVSASHETGCSSESMDMSNAAAGLYVFCESMASIWATSGSSGDYSCAAPLMPPHRRVYRLGRRHRVADHYVAS